MYGPLKRHGEVTNFRLCRSMFFIVRAKESSLSAESRPGSTIIDLVAASASGSRVVGLRPWPFTLLISEPRKACWRFIRPTSEPSPIPCRSRT